MSAQPVEVVSRPGPVGLARAALEAVQALLAGADATFAIGWAHTERTGVIAALDRVIDSATVYRARVLAAHRDDGRWARTGDRSFAGHRARTGRIGIGQARAEAELGQQLTQAPQAAAAVVDGQVPLAYAQVLARARARASEPVRAALDAGGTGELLALAADLDVATFTRRVAAWVAAHDVAAAEQTFDAVRARRFARLTDRDGGTRIEGFVDPLVGAAIRTALDAVTPVPAEDDTRTPEQRVADALETLATRVLGLGADKTGAQIRPHISLIIPAETWTTIRTQRTAQTGGTRESGQTGGTGPERGTGTTGTISKRSGTGTDSGTGTARGTGTSDATAQGARVSGEPDPNDAPVIVLPELDDGTPIPPTALERIACDCEITRIVLDADRVPLDVGRTQRTYTKELRRAILIRDRHCRWPGCTLRATWCDIHHITWYSRGGPTSAGNALTLCAFHHHHVHRHDITITTTPTGHTYHHSDGHLIGVSDRRDGIPHPLVPRPDPTPDRPRPDEDATADNDGQPQPQPRARSTQTAGPGRGSTSPPTAELF